MRQNLWPLVRPPRPSVRAGGLLLALLVACACDAKEPAKHRYLSLGDSFTAGTGASEAEAFPVKLVAKWKASGVTVALKNPAVNGYTTDNLIEEELPLLRSFKPTIVSLAIGANDLVRGSDESHYRAQLQKIFKAILDAGVKPSSIFVIPQPAWSDAPVAEAFGDRNELRAKIQGFNTVLKEEAKAVGARYIDLWPLMLENAEDTAPDGLHPSAKMYDAWAAAIAKELPLK